MSKIVKTSKKLNDLFNELMRLSSDEDATDVLMSDIASKADRCCLEASNDYRAVDYAEYVEAGIDMFHKSLKTGKPIYEVYGTNFNEYILYFVKDLKEIELLLKNAIQKAKTLSESATDEEIVKLEAKLKKLKKNKNI